MRRVLENDRRPRAFAFPAAAEVNIPTDCRIKNRPPGRCGWCALETLARHQHIEPLYGLTDYQARRAGPQDLEDALAENGIGYWIQYRGCYDTKILRDAVRRDRGVLVGFRELYPGKGGHIVTVIDLGPDAVRVIDSNDGDGRTRTMSRDGFFHWWDGFALVLNPD